MRIPKFVVLGSAVILGTIGSLPAQSQRQDSDLQSKAREELRRKMAEMDSAPATSTPVSQPAPTTQVMTPAPAPVKASPPPPMMAPPPPRAVPPPAVSTSTPMLAQQMQQIPMQPTNPNRDKAEEMLRQKMAEMDAQQTPVQPPPRTMPMRSTPVPVATPSVSNDPKARAEAADVAKTEAEVKAKVDAKAKREADKAKTQKAVFPTYGEPAPVTAPPAMSATMSPKDQKLAVLLQQYRADQITPQQYHEQRAKILSGP